ncbi:hypothetical protein Pse7367_0935 [Thalassoporum mexicanum PCC 7367]|uniref:DUF2973 domain-containing protein n=1 Tax=Thalassoporum mexicanum TaxID=3457544 RepID=UPI00029FC877|nr:DUF2973 domain-containing protein [Pseudanabaena sp. PCC 7367]AFY69235.1 hypothetical protein Pse7367_0935 [Pseudanabaena sp. PCC 7367]
MLQILYITAFTALSLLAVRSLFKSMISLAQSEARVIRKPRYPHNQYQSVTAPRAIHPELLDEDGNVTDEPLLVMRSLSFEDARDRLDRLYESSPGHDTIK